VYIAFTLVFALLATLPVTAVGRGGLADGGGISELKASREGSERNWIEIRESRDQAAITGSEGRERPLLDNGMQAALIVLSCSSSLQ